MFAMFSEPILLHWMPTSPRLKTCYVVMQTHIYAEPLERETIKCQLEGKKLRFCLIIIIILTFC